MKIATFNINSIRGRLPRLIEWLDEAHPDVVCLQELRIYHEEFPLDVVRAAGYGALWQGQKPRYNGVAVLARGGDPVGRDAAWNRAIALRRIEDKKNRDGGGDGSNGDGAADSGGGDGGSDGGGDAGNDSGGDSGNGNDGGGDGGGKNDDDCP